ncbi:MAG: HAD-IIIA family hydrolase [Chitinophagaceae bacterium]
MIKEAIILAGGLGTRLRETVPGVPKCMAPVAGKPFLFHVLRYLREQGVEKFIFSLGHMHEMIEAYLESEFPTLRYQCVVETEPLGTGGAIQLACGKATEKDIIVVNGDTLFLGDLSAAFLFHQQHMAECTLLLKPMTNIDRYGVVELNGEQLVSAFREKQFYASGNINAGSYILHVPKFLDEEFPDKFSFEKDYLAVYYTKRRIYGQVQNAYFIDIGIPEDYTRAGIELARPPLDLRRIDVSWTLFIDRDGVINHEKQNDYIRNWDEFLFYEGVLDALRKINGKFGKFIVLTNQRGVGRGLMTESDLRFIHEKMQDEIGTAGGRIDRVYYCTSTDDMHPDRKPNPGMAFHAAREIPGVDLSRAIMLGNKLSDMRFARNAGIYGIFLATTHPETPFPHPDIDLRFSSLPDFVNHL